MKTYWQLNMVGDCPLQRLLAARFFDLNLISGTIGVPPPANKKNQSGDRGIQKASQVQNRGEKQPHHELLGGDREFWRFLLFLEFCLFWHSIWLSIAIIWHILQETNTVFSSHPSSTIISYILYCTVHHLLLSSIARELSSILLFTTTTTTTTTTVSYTYICSLKNPFVFNCFYQNQRIIL